jgi:hypothetical protein
MSHQRASLKIIPFKNRGGTLSFRVSRTILGERVQKNFPTQLAAEEFRDELLARAKQGDSEPVRKGTGNRKDFRDYPG